MIGIPFSRASAKAVASRHLEIAVECLLERDPVVALGLRVLFRVGAVDPVDVGRLEHRVALHLGGAQHRRRVGGEERIAGAAGEHHDAVLLEMAQRPRALIGLADLRHVERRHGARRRAEPLDRGFQHSAFITVASMPIESAVGRDRLLPDIFTPRRMLPPPTTTPSVTPALRAAIRSVAMRSMVGWWMPKPSGPDSASPDTLTMTRR